MSNKLFGHVMRKRRRCWSDDADLEAAYLERAALAREWGERGCLTPTGLLGSRSIISHITIERICFI